MTKVYHNTDVLPDRAGQVHLIYKDTLHPLRKNEIIQIPKDNYVLYILPDTSQFLLASEGKGHRTWFGGTDESPFLVELQDSDYGEKSYFVSMWEKGIFYEELKPSVIKYYEKKYGQEKTRRQGDFFIYPLPGTKNNWEQIIDWAQAFGKDVDVFTASKGGQGLPINGSRHTFFGEHLRGSSGGVTIVKGVLEAPDHKTLEIPDISIIAQINHLKNRERAD